MEWSAKVHKTGSQVQLLKNGTVAKVIKADTGAFKPEEAHKFAASLVNELNKVKTAKQMTDGEAKPTVATPAEKHEIALKEVKSDAKGTDVMGKAATDLAKENTALKKKVARLEKESALERKARRGLAIAKELVAQNKLANTEEAIKAAVVDITRKANDEIVLLERKVAGLPLYPSKDEAAQESRKYARLSRLHKSAADDAQSVNDIKTADAEDVMAEHYAALAEEAKKFAYSTDGEYGAFKDGPAPSKPDDAINQAEDTVKGTDVNGDMPKHASRAQAIYLKIATDHEALAVAAEAAGKTKEAAVEREIAAESREYASMFNTAAVGAKEAEVAAAAKEAEATAPAKEATTEGAKEASKEDDKEAAAPAAKEAEVAAVATKEAEAPAAKEAAKDEKKEEAKEEKKEEEVDHKAAAASYRKIAALHRKRADEFESKNQTDKADFEDKMADSADTMANDHESMFKKLSDPAMDAPAASPVLNAAPAPVLDQNAAPALDANGNPLPMLDQNGLPLPAAAPAAPLDAAPVDMNQNSDANDDTKHDDAGMDTTDLWNKDDGSSAHDDGDKHHDHGSDKMPSDDEVDAAMHYSMGLFGDDEKAEGEDNNKQAQTRKIEEISKSASRSADRPEQNDASNDPTVGGLESLWRK